MLNVCLLAAALSGGAAASPVSVETILAENRLGVRIVGVSATPVLVTGRTALGPYLEVEVRDVTGRLIGFLGPRVTAEAARRCDFRVLAANEFFGRLFDLSLSGSIRLAGGGEADFEVGREYEIVVKYRDFDFRTLTGEEKRWLRRELGPFVELAHETGSRPLRIRLR